MSRLDELPPDQSAALSLLLRQRKSYAEVASLLGIGEQAVHDRAHAALVMLAPRRARELTPERRLEIGDYLLGQQAGVAERLRTRTYLSSSEPGRAWAGELASELGPLAGASLPEIPTAADAGAGGSRTGAREPQRVADLSASPAPAAAGIGATGSGPPAPTRSSAPSSRTAGAVLLAVLAAAAIVAVVLITSGGSSGAKKTSTGAKTTTAKGNAKGPKVDAQIKLTPTNPANKAVAVVYVLSEGTKQAFFIAAQNLPETKGFYYAIWLYNSPKSFLALSRSPAVGSSHSLAGGSALPSNADQFREILLTDETTAKPHHPGHVVMRGPFRI
jgi:Sigma-70, region 4